MRQSQLFGTTLHDTPKEAEVISHQLLMRAGFICPLGAGIFSYLHLARRCIQKIETIMREEMDKIGGQEISMPVVQPADIWKETGRWYQIGSEMGRFQDKNGHDMLLAMTHEEVVSDLVRHVIQSYKQLPRLIYHIQTKWRDDPRPRAGLIRVREFTMKDSYSLDADWEGLDKQYRAHYQAYFDIFHRSGIRVTAVKSDPGMMGGKVAHEYMYLTPIGEDTLILCNACGYTANRQVARFQKTPAIPEKLNLLVKVSTPACKSIEELANFLGVPKAKTAKAVFFIASIPDGNELVEVFIFAVIRGDMDLNEAKLISILGARDLRPATEAEIREIGAEPGYASPIGLQKTASKPIRIVADDSISFSVNLVAGANEPGNHLLNSNIPRDYQPDIVADIASADNGHSCPVCSCPLHTERGVEVGNIFKLGTRYSESLNCTFLDYDGCRKPVIMGSYGIGVGRLLACVAEQNHDENGLIWPVSIAPYQVHLIHLRGKSAPEIGEAAEKIYQVLQAVGMEVLYDDRDESPGVKFKDADLIGLPIRITVSERAFKQGSVEIKLRSQTKKEIISIDRLAERIISILETLNNELRTLVVPVPYIE